MKGKLYRSLLSALLALSLLCALFSAYAVAAEPSPTAFGIDVSHHQGSIQWEKTAKEIDFAILRCGYGSNITAQDDRQWYANVQACTELEIPFGVYLYSYAVTEEQARSEAAHVLRLIEGNEPTLPIFLDLEDQSLLDNCTAEEILHHAKIFCEIIETAGYEVGIYSGHYWWTNYLTSPEYDQWPRWIARYADSLNYSGTYTIWQYSSTGRVAGIEGNVDMNHWYGAFPEEETEHQHSYVPHVTEATCTSPGFTKYVCDCGHSYHSNYTAALGHLWDEGRVTVQPTVQQEGSVLYCCIRCTAEKTVSIPPLEEEVPCDGGANCPGRVFSDMPAAAHWAHEGIDYVLEQGLFQGMGQGKFQPDTDVSRAMIVTVLWRYAGQPQEEGKYFSDVDPQSWYGPAVAWASACGVVEGVGEARFAPEAPVTREQLATILYRYTEGQTSKEGQLREFADGLQVSPWAAQAMAWAVEQGLVRGALQDGAVYLMPQGSATRAQVAAVIMRYAQGEGS